MRFVGITFILAILFALPLAGGGAQQSPPPAEARFPCTAVVAALEDSLQKMLDKAILDIDRKDYASAAAILQFLYVQHGDSLIRLKPGEETYVSVRREILRLIESAGKPLLDAFVAAAPADRPAVRRAAADLDVRALAEFARNYPLSEAGLSALETLAQCYFEAQRYEEALWALCRLERFRRPASLSPRLLALRLACAAALGDAKEFDSFVSRLGQADASAEIRWLGREITLTEMVESLKKSLNDAAVVRSYNPLTSRSSPPGTDPSPPQKIAYSGAIPADEALGPLAAATMEDRSFVESYPTLSDGTIYLRTRRFLYAAPVSDPGRLLWRRPLEDGEALAAKAWAGTDGDMRRIYPAVAAGGRVYTLAPSAEVAASGADRFSVLQLVCLDGRTGRVLWRVGGIRGERLVDRLHFAGAPTVVGNSVFAVALSASPRIGESYCLVCLDAATGSPRYIADVSTQVDSKIAGVATTTLFPPAPPLVKSGTVYVATNAGAVAAFDALFGETLWVTRYDQTNGVTARSFESRFERASAREASFDYGPLFEEDGRLFVAPTESDRLLAVESRTGRLLWSFDNSARRFAYMLGARDRALYLSGDECAALDCATGRPLWPDAPDVPAFRGRGFIAGKFLVVPSLKALLYFNLSSGKLENSVSLAGLAAGGAVDVSSYAGTLLWLEGRLAAVSNNRLTIFDAAAKNE